MQKGDEVQPGILAALHAFEGLLRAGEQLAFVDCTEDEEAVLARAACDPLGAGAREQHRDGRVLHAVVAANGIDPWSDHRVAFLGRPALDHPLRARLWSGAARARRADAELCRHVNDDVDRLPAAIR